MPVFDETIFYPEIKTRELGFTDEDIEVIVDCFRWLLNQRSRRLDRQRIIALLKSRMDQLIQLKKTELARDVEALKFFSKM